MTADAAGAPELGDADWFGMNAEPAPVPQATRPAARPKASTETPYEIRDATGALIAIHVRIDQPGGRKRFEWRLPDGTIGLDGFPIADLPLYAVDRLNGSQTVVLAEGEKATDALLRAGIPAVGTVTGAAACPGPAPLAELGGRRVVLWPDNDRPGAAHMERVAKGLLGIASTIHRIDWPDAPEHADAHDFLQTRTTGEVLELVENAADVAPDVEVAPVDDGQRVKLEQVGPSYRVTVEPFGATFMFRDVRLDRELSADVTVERDRRHLFRSTSTLSLTGRKTIARTARELDSRGGSEDAWRRATFAAAEAVMRAEEQLGGGVDLRVASTRTNDPLWVAEPFWPSGASLFVMPGESGKSTIARALAVSLATGRQVLPGISPRVRGPVVYLAAEDPVAFWHSRNIEAICKGLGIERRVVEHTITLIEARGRPLHRLARSLGERASDAAGVILDAQQALLPSAEQSGVRDRDSLFWNGIDELACPCLILAHPNRAESRDWDRADGRAAGSEVNRDRARIAWRGTFKDELAVEGTSHRRYTLSCTKWNHGPRPAPIAFGACWEFGYGDDPGTLRFEPCDPVERQVKAHELTPAVAETLEAYRAGATTPASLMRAIPAITSVDTAKSRLRRLQDYLAAGGDE